MSEDGKCVVKWNRLDSQDEAEQRSVRCCRFGIFEARFWNSGSFSTQLAFFENTKARQNLAFFSRKGLSLAKHRLSCIFITNLFWQESMTMQSAKKCPKNDIFFAPCMVIFYCALKMILLFTVVLKRFYCCPKNVFYCCTENVRV